jgi:WD40 repeat protein
MGTVSLLRDGTEWVLMRVRPRRSWLAVSRSCLLPMGLLGCGQVLDFARSAPSDVGIDAAGSPSAADAGMGASHGSDGSLEGASVARDAGTESAASDSAASQGAVDPSVSGQWSWKECGSIAPTPLATQGQFLPSGELVVSYADGSILVHSASTWRPVRQLAAANGTASTFGVSLDGTLLATAGTQPSQLLLLSTADGSNVADLVQPPECASGALQFSAEGDYVFETGGNSTCIWRTSDGALVAEMPGALSSAAIRMGQLVAVDNGASNVPTSPALLTYSLPATACAAPCAPPVQGPSVPLDVSPSWGVPSNQLRISPRGDSVAGEVVSLSSAYTGTAGSALWRSDGTLAYSSFSQPAQVTVYSPAGERVLLTDRVVNVASAAVESLLTQQAMYDDYSAIDSSGQLALTNFSSGVALFDLPSGEPLDVVGAIPPPAPTGVQPNDMAASADGTHFLVGTMMWRIDPDFVQSNIVSIDQTAIRIDDAFSPDGTEYVVSGDRWGGIESTETGATIESPAPPPPNISPSCFVTGARLSPRNDWFLVGAYDNSVSVLDISNNTQVARLPTVRCDGRAVFTADESLVVTTDPALYRVSDWSQVWNSASGEEAGSNGGAWDDVQIRPNANSVLVSHCGSASCEHALYSLTDGTVIQTLPQLTNNRAKFSPEGNWVVSGARLLHLPDGQQRVLDPAPVLAAFVPNGDVIALLADSTLARYCRSK